MKYTLKRHEQEKAMILATMHMGAGKNKITYLAFIVHEDMVDQDILEAIARGGEVVVEFKMDE